MLFSFVDDDRFGINDENDREGLEERKTLGLSGLAEVNAFMLVSTLRKYSLNIGTLKKVIQLSSGSW